MEHLSKKSLESLHKEYTWCDRLIKITDRLSKGKYMFYKEIFFDTDLATMLPCYGKNIKEATVDFIMRYWLHEGKKIEDIINLILRRYHNKKENR